MSEHCVECLRQLDLLAYCRAGGAREACAPCADLGAAAALRACTSSWRASGGVTCTFAFESHTIDLTFDAGGGWSSDQFRPHPSAIPAAFREVSLDDAASIASIVVVLRHDCGLSPTEVWGDGAELVVMLSSGATMYFERRGHSTHAALAKVIARGAVGEASRQLARRVLRCAFSASV